MMGLYKNLFIKVPRSKLRGIIGTRFARTFSQQAARYKPILAPRLGNTKTRFSSLLYFTRPTSLIKQSDIKIKHKYKELNIQIPEMLDFQQYQKMLKKVQEKIPDRINFRIFPTSFSPEGYEGGGFFRAGDWRWDTLEEHLKSSGALGVLVRLPLFWQVEPLIYYACKNAGSFLFLNDASNMPVGRVAIKNASFNTIVTTSDDALEFSKHIQEHNCNDFLNWIVVHPINDIDINRMKISYANTSYIAHEVHLFPGIPLFVQCSHLARGKSHHFHVASEFSLDTLEGSISLTGNESDAVPLYKVSINVSATREKKKCPCGREVFILLAT